MISPFRGSKLRNQRTLNQAVLKTKPSPQPQGAHALKRDGELVVDGSDTTHSAAHGSSPSPKIVAPSWARELATTPCYLDYLDYLVYVLGIRRSQLRGRLGRRRVLEAPRYLCVPNKLGFGIRWVGSPVGRRAPVDPASSY